MFNPVDVVVDTGVTVVFQCAGDCTCNEGFAGPKCSECAPGWHGYPACEQCACDPAGSLNVDTCEGDCSCKVRCCSRLKRLPEIIGSRGH